MLYDVYVGNGQQIIQGQIDMRSGGNDHGKPIYGGRLGYQWTSGPAEGLTLGGTRSTRASTTTRCRRA